jgi:cytochrome c oxidase assembly protein subunit 15
MMLAFRVSNWLYLHFFTAMMASLNRASEYEFWLMSQNRGLSPCSGASMRYQALSAGAHMSHHPTPNRAVYIWLLIIAGMVCVMILVGGITRLTDSGLSITEWKPVSGAIPPLSDQAWLADFERYQQTTEFQVQNSAMTLNEFRAIFWWEWGHRQLGRLIGLAMAIPLLVFWLRGNLTPRLKPRLVGLLILIGVQGAIGWWMVASGLVDRLDVSQYRLATHLGIAFVILGSAIWLAQESRFGAPPKRIGLLSAPLTVLWGLVLVQIVLGAFVAGLDAGRIYNTWPGMNGDVIPSDYLAGMPFLQAIFESHAAVQMHHRWTGYLIVLATGGVAYLIHNQNRLALKPFMIILPALIIGQAALGIAALLAVVPLELALAHQAGAIALFVATGLAVWVARRDV